MRDITEPYGLCSIDPITLTGLALAGAAGAAGTAAVAGGGSSPAPTPAPLPQAAPPPQAPDTAVKSTLPQKPTFIGGVPSPPAQTGQKTLLGQ